MTSSDSNPITSELGDHRDYLLRFARRQLHDSALAEDLVHDVLTTAIAGSARFEHRSSLRTWLTGILKHKIVDAIRRRAGECSLDALMEAGDAWPVPPALTDLADPSVLAEQRQSLARALSRIEALPASLRRAFEMRVLLEHSASEVCRALAINEGNLWVRLHRARKELAAA